MKTKVKILSEKSDGNTNRITLEVSIEDRALFLPEVLAERGAVTPFKKYLRDELKEVLERYVSQAHDVFESVTSGTQKVSE